MNFDFSLLEWFLIVIGVLFLSYVWFRIISMAIFTSWVQVANHSRCPNCVFYQRVVKGEQNEKEKKCEEQKREEEIKEQK